MRLTERDRQIIELVFAARALRDDQIQIALFTDGGASRCQRRLTLLVRHKCLGRLPRKHACDPAIYVLDRRSVNGNEMIKEAFGEEEFRRGLGRLGFLDHLLAVNDVRVRVIRACRELGYALKLWQTSEQLASRLKPYNLIPDAYFQICRVVDGRERTSAYFLEMERSGKSAAVLRSKLDRYGRLYYGGAYQEIFGTPALRLLVVTVSYPGFGGKPRVKRGMIEAKRAGVTMARFATLDALKEASPCGVLIDPVWYPVEGDDRVALFIPPPDRPKPH